MVRPKGKQQPSNFQKDLSRRYDSSQALDFGNWSDITQRHKVVKHLSDISKLYEYVRVVDNTDSV